MNGNFFRIATEFFNVCLNPVESTLLVKHCIVTWQNMVFSWQKSQRIQSYRVFTILNFQFIGFSLKWPVMVHNLWTKLADDMPKWKVNVSNGPFKRFILKFVKVFDLEITKLRDILNKNAMVISYESHVKTRPIIDNNWHKIAMCDLISGIIPIRIPIASEWSTMNPYKYFKVSLKHTLTNDQLPVFW